MSETDDRPISFARLGPVLAVCCMLVFAFITGVRGLNFGFHWDEPLILDIVRHSIASHSLLPHWYNYPSLSVDLALFVGVVQRFSISSFSLQMATRALFLILSLLTGIWAYFLTKLLSNSPWTGVVA